MALPRPPNVAAPVTALTAVAKLFAWPLFVWLLATRRIRTAFAAASVAVGLLVGGWAAIGFAGLHGYPHLLRVLSRVEAVQSYSLLGLFRLEGGAATALTALLSVAVVVAVVLAARGPDGDRRALTVAVAGVPLATPVLWLHYLVLLFVPIALARAALGALVRAARVLGFSDRALERQRVADVLRARRRGADRAAVARSGG